MAVQGGDQKPLNAFSRWIAVLETLLAALSATAMFAIMCIVMLDVVLRYVFAAPLVWSFDLIGLYLVGAVFFFALSDTMQQHGHIALDVFVPLIPHRLRHAAQSAGFAASALLLAAITWLEATRPSRRSRPATASRGSCRSRPGSRTRSWPSAWAFSSCAAPTGSSSTRLPS